MSNPCLQGSGSAMRDELREMQARMQVLWDRMEAPDVDELEYRLLNFEFLKLEREERSMLKLLRTKYGYLTTDVVAIESNAPGSILPLFAGTA